MTRTRDKLVPITETFSALEGLVKKTLQPLPQAIHHFTQADQVDQLVGASEADADMGFMVRLLALCSLPRTNPGNRKEYVRRNGPYALVMSAGGLNKLPYGNLPRLLLSWVCTEAVRTQSRELVLGRSLSEFMRKVGMEDRSGSERGDRTRLRNQMKRLFGCTVSMIYEDSRGYKRVSSLVADVHEFWWDPKRPDDRMLWESKIELGEKFFNEIIQHPVPLDMNILKALKRCSLGLDLYLWLNYRTFAIRSPLQFTWRQLYRQFDENPIKAPGKRAIQDFRRKVLRELKKIKIAWPALHYAPAKGVLIVFPSRPTILPAKRRLLE